MLLFHISNKHYSFIFPDGLFSVRIDFEQKFLSTNNSSICNSSLIFCVLSFCNVYILKCLFDVNAFYHLCDLVSTGVARNFDWGDQNGKKTGER